MAAGTPTTPHVSIGCLPQRTLQNPARWATSVLQGPPGARHLPLKRSPSCSGSSPSLPAPARHCASRVGGLHRMFWNMSQALLTPPAGRGTGALGSQPPPWWFLCYGQGQGTRTQHLAMQSPDPS